MITLLVVAACLFVLGLLFGKRFGVLILALTAGLVLTQYIGSIILTVGAPYLKQYSSYVPAVLVVLPSLVLLLLGKGRHRRIFPRIINAAVYAFAGLLFIIAAPQTPVSISSSFPPIVENLNYLIAGLIAVAILEIIFGRVAKKKDDEKPGK